MRSSTAGHRPAHRRRQQTANDAILAQLDALGIDGEAKCLAAFIQEANIRGLTAWKDAGGNPAPWSRHRRDQPRPARRGAAQQLYRKAAQRADRLQRMTTRMRLTNPPSRTRRRRSRTPIGFPGDDMLNTSARART